jgi:hypothetical protein
MVDSSTHQRINQHVWRMYPEFKGVYPEERSPSSGSSKTTAVVLTYKTRVALPGGKELPRWVKVNVSSSGEIQKISSSK